MEDYELSELGKRIKAVRKSKKKTQDEVAHAIGVGKITVSLWERGLQQPGILNILNYCNFLGMTLDELLGLTGKQTLHLTMSEEERQMILAMLDECKDTPDPESYRHQLHALEAYLTGILSRAHE